MRVETGLDRVSGDAGASIRGRRIGLVAHPASVDSGLGHAEQRLTAAGARVAARFGPEHGYGGEAQDMEPVADGQTAGSVPVHSLYARDASSLRPSAAALRDLDMLVVDLQDVGSRYYTFVWTAALCLEACHGAGLTLLALDRPNPIGGHLVEGPGIEPGFESFVGHHDLATRHGMTLGEVLKLYADDEGLADALEVVPMAGYRRDLWFEDTGLPWVLPSPNMPTRDTALVYPGACLLEGTNLSEGRGTARPFEIVGAPWIDGRALARRLERSHLAGCAFRPCTFKPAFHKHADRVCGGVQIHVTDKERFRPVRTGVALLLAAFELGGGQTAWRDAPYEFVSERPAIDLLAGGAWLRHGVEAGAELGELCAGWQEAEAAFETRRARALLYPSSG
jgi:uncharacterized protein YbbC (DUF1343 family)